MVRVEVDANGFTKNGRRIGRPRIDRSQLSCTGCGGPRTDEIRSRCRTCLSAERKNSRHKNPEAAIKYRRQWAARNRDKVNEYGRRNYAKNAEAFKRRAREWQKRNPKKVSATMAFQNARRRSRKKANGGRGFRKADWRVLVERAGGLCCYCREASVGSVDHFVPLKRGGLDDRMNIAPSCGRCNTLKRDNEPVAWVTQKFGAARLKYVGSIMFVD